MNRDAPNNLIRYRRQFLKEYLTQCFKLDSSIYWKGSTIFWQIDEWINIHAGKTMLYDSEIKSVQSYSMGSRSNQVERC